MSTLICLTLREYLAALALMAIVSSAATAFALRRASADAARVLAGRPDAVASCSNAPGWRAWEIDCMAPDCPCDCLHHQGELPALPLLPAPFCPGCEHRQKLLLIGVGQGVLPVVRRRWRSGRDLKRPT